MLWNSREPVREYSAKLRSNVTGDPLLIVLFASNSLKVNNKAMRLRATLTNLLTVILLSLSSVVTACDAKCDLAQGSGACHQSTSGQMQMPAMAGMQNEGCCGTSSTFSAPHACQHHACAAQPALATEHFGFNAHVASSAMIVAFNPKALALGTMDQSIPVRGPPLFRTPSPVSLHTTLRV